MFKSNKLSELDEEEKDKAIKLMQVYNEKKRQVFELKNNLKQEAE